MTEDQFVDEFVKNWTEECAKQGIGYIDSPHSTTRLLARVLARTLVPPSREDMIKRVMEGK